MKIYFFTFLLFFFALLISYKWSFQCLKYLLGQNKQESKENSLDCLGAYSNVYFGIIGMLILSADALCKIIFFLLKKFCS